MNRLLFFGIISMVIISGEALMCYECTLCDDVAVKNATKRNCTEFEAYGVPQCYKLDYVLSNGTTLIGARRECASRLNVNSKTLRAANDSGVYVRSGSVYYCDTDLCNNSESPYSTSTIIFVTIITFICAIKNLY